MTDSPESNNESLVHTLSRKIKQANEAYAEGRPFLTDEDYDKLWQQLRAIAPTHPLLWHTSQSATKGLFPHPQPLLSLNKIFTLHELEIFLTRYTNEPLYLEPKYHGISAAFYPTSGKVALSGTGQYGKDVTAFCQHIQLSYNAHTWRQLGELIITKANWSDDLGKAPHTTVAGLFNAKDPDPERLSLVSFIPYGEDSHLINPPYNAEDLWSLCLDLYLKWSALYPLDGIVLKVADERVRTRDGHNTTFPYWAIAWKPPIQTATTEVEDVEWNVSRSGRVIPTVIYKEVQLCGTSNQRCTGNNARWVGDKGIGIGAKVTIGKAGEIIPKLLSVSSRVTPKLPMHCPVCGEALFQYGVHLVCHGTACIAQLVSKLTYFYSKTGVEIPGVSAKTLELILQHPGCRSELSTRPWWLLLANLDGMVINLLVRAGISPAMLVRIQQGAAAASGTTTYVDLMVALGIPGIGRRNATRLAKIILLGESHSIPQTVLSNFTTHMEQWTTAITNLTACGFQFQQLKPTGSEIFAITGALPVSRSEAINTLENLGWEYSPSGVTSRCTILIKGDITTSSKLTKAQARQDISIFSYEDALHSAGSTVKQ